MVDARAESTVVKEEIRKRPGMRKSIANLERFVKRIDAALAEHFSDIKEFRSNSE